MNEVHLERQREALTGSETKHAGIIGWTTQAAAAVVVGGGGAAAGSPLIRSAALINQHASFIFIPPVCTALER